MLAPRVIPVMLTKGRALVKGQRFDNSRVVGVALQAARIHAARGVDELCMIDVSATSEGRTIDFEMVEELTTGCFIPVTVGGGIRTLSQIRDLLRRGADKVLIGEAGRQDITFIKKAAQAFGSQAIVASIDYPESTVLSAIAADMAGAGEILFNDSTRDGTMEGLDIPLFASVARQLSCPMIACGGCAGYEDIRRAIQAGASAVGVGALFQFQDATPAGAARYLRQYGCEARL